jgi:hypothetical protein
MKKLTTVSDMRMRIIPMLLVITVTFARGSSDSALTSIVQKMERAQAEVGIPNHVKRDYQLSRMNNAGVDSEVIADIDFRLPCGAQKFNPSSINNGEVRFSA